MALQDIDNMDVAVREVARVLVSGGSFVIAIVHPVYSGGGFMESRATDSHFEVTRSYFEAMHRSLTTRHKDLSMTFHREHRPLKDYTRALTDAGFVIEELNELTDPRSAGRGIPMYLDILARRQLAGR
jgi:ubiquinone/menaquinone biosynthesis C-methylase UbiE